MAHFAILDENNIVIKVLSIENSFLYADFKDKIEIEELGKKYIASIIGITDLTKIVQTSYNDNFRKRYAGIGHIYDKQRDAFIPPKLCDSWVMNEETCSWEPPVPLPKDSDQYYYLWDEPTLSWIKEEDFNP